MKRKRKAANLVNGANGKSKFSNTQSKVSDYRRINQTAADIMPLAIVLTEQPHSMRGTFMDLYVSFETGILAMVRPDRVDPMLSEGRRFQVLSPDGLSAALCYFVENYGIKRVVTADAPVIHELRAYCEKRGIEYVAN